jgi:hypothetical protein
MARMLKPDQTKYLAHFTKPQRDNQGKVQLSAKKCLLKLLKEKTIIASSVPWTQAQAVCFTECPWTSLIAHSKKYSPYGVGFSKEFIFANQGAPALYIRRDVLGERDWKECVEKSIYWAVTPFWPKFNPSTRLEPYDECDYTHEREWRTPRDLNFEESDIQFVIVKAYDDIKDIKNVIPNISLDKILTIQNYRKIEDLWPVHKIEITN